MKERVYGRLRIMLSARNAGEKIHIGEFTVLVAFYTQTMTGESTLVNPRQLVRALARAMPTRRLAYRPGKKAIRALIMHQIACSARRADALIDTLEVYGFLQYSGSNERAEEHPGRWRFVVDPQNEQRFAATWQTLLR